MPVPTVRKTKQSYPLPAPYLCFAQRGRSHIGVNDRGGKLRQTLSQRSAAPGNARGAGDGPLRVDELSYASADAVHDVAQRSGFAHEIGGEVQRVLQNFVAAAVRARRDDTPREEFAVGKLHQTARCLRATDIETNPRERHVRDRRLWQHGGNSRRRGGNVFG